MTTTAKKTTLKRDLYATTIGPDGRDAAEGWLVVGTTVEVTGARRQVAPPGGSPGPNDCYVIATSPDGISSHERVDRRDLAKATAD